MSTNISIEKATIKYGQVTCSAVTMHVNEGDNIAVDYSPKNERCDEYVCVCFKNTRSPSNSLLFLSLDQAKLLALAILNKIPAKIMNQILDEHANKAQIAECRKAMSAEAV